MALWNRRVIPWLKYGNDSGLSPYFGDLVSVMQMFSIKCNHIYALGPRCLSGSTSTSSMPSAYLGLTVAITFLYPSSVNG